MKKRSVFARWFGVLVFTVLLPLSLFYRAFVLLDRSQGNDRTNATLLLLSVFLLGIAINLAGISGFKVFGYFVALAITAGFAMEIASALSNEEVDKVEDN